MLEGEFQEHPIHNTVTELLTRLEGGPLRDDMSDEQQVVQSGLTRAVQRLQLLLADADPALINSTTLHNGLYKPLNPASGHLDNYKSDGNSQHLESASGAINAALPAFAQIGPRLEAKDQKRLVEVAHSLRRDGELVFAQAKKRLSELSSTQDALQARIEASKSEFQSLQNQVTELKSRADDVIAKLQTTAQQREDDRTDTFDKQREVFRQEQAKQLKEAEEKTKALIASLESNATETNEKLVKGATEVETELTGILSKSKELFELIGNTAITGKFSNAAKLHANAADSYRLFAIVLMLAAAVFVIWQFAQFSEIGWKEYTARFSSTLLLLFPAFYAIKESAKHRNAAIRNQRIELELAALEPFISGLDDTEQKKIKATLTTKYFGQDHGGAESDHSSLPVPMKDLLDMLKSAIKGK